MYIRKRGALGVHMVQLFHMVQFSLTVVPHLGLCLKICFQINYLELSTQFVQKFVSRWRLAVVSLQNYLKLKE